MDGRLARKARGGNVKPMVISGLPMIVIWMRNGTDVANKRGVVNETTRSES